MAAAGAKFRTYRKPIVLQWIRHARSEAPPHQYHPPLEIVMEGSDDSESGSIHGPPPPTTVESSVGGGGDDDDDAESCSEITGGGFRGADGDYEYGEEMEWTSWRNWAAECARARAYEDYEVDAGELSAAGANSGAGVGLRITDLESDKLFWEACIAHGY